MGIAKLELARLAGYKRSGSELASQHWKDFAGCWLNCRLAQVSSCDLKLAHISSGISSRGTSSPEGACVQCVIHIC